MAKIKFKAEIKRGKTKPTQKLMKKYYQPAVVESMGMIRDHYKDIQSRFSPKNRRKTKTMYRAGNVPIGFGRGIWGAIGVDDDYCVIHWLEGGTDIRYRALSKDWRSMTRANSGLTFYPRSGRATGFIPGGTMGIEPRNFRDAIIKDIETKVYRVFYEAHLEFVRRELA